MSETVMKLGKRPLGRGTENLFATFCQALKDHRQLWGALNHKLGKSKLAVTP